MFVKDVDLPKEKKVPSSIVAMKATIAYSVYFALAVDSDGVAVAVAVCVAMESIPTVTMIVRTVSIERNGIPPNCCKCYCYCYCYCC